MKHTQTRSLLLCFVVLVTTISLCGINNIAQGTPYGDESVPATASCMLGFCETLISKNLSTLNTISGFSSLFSLTFFLFLCYFFQARIPFKPLFFSDLYPCRKNPCRLYQLHATFLI